jgi:hypothetical protein
MITTEQDTTSALFGKHAADFHDPNGSDFELSFAPCIHLGPTVVTRICISRNPGCRSLLERQRRIDEVLFAVAMEVR